MFFIKCEMNDQKNLQPQVSSAAALYRQASGTVKGIDFFNKAVKEVAAVMRAGGRFGVILHAEYRIAAMGHAF